ncbi:MAG: DUF1573 domain-containing protein [Planctomycetes bacterium]|nr:DUF1573 domain-containing protein [Planctomycetota bacterium]
MVRTGRGVATVAEAPAGSRLKSRIEEPPVVRHVARFALIVILLSPAVASAQEWARKMFKETSHEFGVVARGAKVEHRFTLQNLYKEEIHIAGVRSSCGCTSPEVTVDTLKTWDKADIVATFNTRSFLGSRSATLTVTIDRPYYAEVQLHVSGYIRSDIVFEPGLVQFGEVDQGAGAETRVRVSYAGRPDWRITDVRSANEDLEVEIQEAGRRGGNVAYNMTVRLKKGAKAGYINDQLTLVSNDGYRESIPLAVEGRVRSALTVSPTPLVLGSVGVGDEVTKKILVRGKTPFKVVSVASDVEGFRFDVDSESEKATHFIPMTFRAAKSGKIAVVIRIETNLGGSCVVELPANGDVKAVEVSEPTGPSE